ncbi:epi-neemfruitin B 7-O-acetyltransferse L7AT-like [Apium graveolens]|uniref:epi-neemfruitin B 7-O-acetyltransferse L7AT-like n=1 Tax=Apium graveolens TaxID=4045 RepID=UPI003D7BA1C4
MEKMVVQIGTKENILPAAPTPNSLRIFKLSVLDQTQVKLYVPLMLFYLNQNTSNLNSLIQDRSKLLKLSLSESLTRFYHFAGKVRDDFHIDCNDEGVHYIETRLWWNCTSPINFSKIKIVSQRFIFNGLSLVALKDQSKVLSSESEPSRFEVVAALLWKCVAKSASKLYESSLGRPFNMGVIINLQGKNCVPRNSVGNLIWPALAQCKLSPELEHKTLVNQIKKCKAEINDDFVEAIKGVVVIIKATESLLLVLK